MNRQSWMQLTAVQAGGAICLPIFLIGNLLAEQYGLYSALLGIVLGNLILLGLGLISGYASARDRKSTAEYAVEVFGSFGKRFFALAMVLTMMGWFAIQLNIMGQSLLQVSGFPVPQFVVNILFGMLISIVALLGTQSLNILANLSMPVLIFTIGYAVFQASHEPMSFQAEPPTFAGVSLVLAAAIGVVVDIPTFFREARSSKESMIATVLLFGGILPLLECVGVYLNIHSQGGNLLEVLTTPGASMLWSVWVASFLALAGWTTNNANLYSASVSLETTLPKVDAKLRVFCLGMFGTAISLFSIEENLAEILNVIGVILSSMGAVLSLHYLSKQKISNGMNLMICCLGVIAAVIGLTGIPVLDGYLGAFILGCIIKLGVKNERSYNFGS